MIKCRKMAQPDVKRTKREEEDRIWRETEDTYEQTQATVIDMQLGMKKTIFKILSTYSIKKPVHFLQKKYLRQNF